MRGWVIVVAALGLAACGSPRPAPHTVGELLQDPILLQGVADRCASHQSATNADVECSNARLAVERLGAQEEASHVGERGAEFERQRALRRAREEQARTAAERSGGRFDPYSSPVTADSTPPTVNP